MADTEEIAQLRAEIAALREDVVNLHRDLRAARSHIDLTMRGQLRCRACNCRRIAHAPRVLDRTRNMLSDEPLALYRVHVWSDDARGELEAYICTRCGLVEWWVIDPSALEPHEEHLRILDGDVSGPKDPYR